MGNNRPKLVLSITDAFCLGFLRGQAKYMKDSGFDVFLICPDGPGLDDYGRNEGCTIIKLPYKREISLFSDIKNLWLTYKTFRKIKPDIINVGTPKAGLLGVAAGWFAGVNVRIFTLRGLRSTAEPEGTQKRVVEFMERLTHHFATKVISITPSMAKYAVENRILSKEKVVVLAKASSNGINVSRFTPSKSNAPEVQLLRQELGIGREDFVIGYVGRVVKSKGVEEIFRAFQTIKKKYKRIKLLFVGPVELTSDSVDERVLEKMNTDEDIIMAGKRSDVEYCYHVMNVFTLPSHNFREGFGNVAMEASACGIPIIVTKGAGCQDAVIDGKTGKLIAPIDDDELADAFEFYINNPEEAREHGQNGIVYANEFFRNDIIWEAQLSLYNSLLKK
ncbi:glycosyltransferase family 4 protein [Sphingobacterium sp. FBM7-1]|uniref:glycosyltransferase family 4 protein n=1 Tax=Sphingobacterium sp. FBM7-1 TaxID=2886688 RepID=UPI001D104DCD|nr:glycosyltransferase family 4 protein [Sphingobacterium sp. FBM7-1]MCC2600008.1 glycosyltransferase family 4 protein [Sphingobacterium sp. FBM7-1]